MQRRLMLLIGWKQEVSCCDDTKIVPGLFSFVLTFYRHVVGSVSRRRAHVTSAAVIMWCGFSVGRSGVCDVTDPCLSDLRLRSEFTHVHLWEASAAAETVNDHMIVVPLWWTDEWWCETSISNNKDHFYLLSAECVSIYNFDAASPRIFNDGFHEYRQNQPVIYILLLCFISSAA